MNLLKIVLIIALNVLASTTALADNNPIHTTHYDVTIQPDIQKRFIKGTTILNFESLTDGLDHLSFPINGLTIKSVFVGNAFVPFSVSNDILNITLNPKLKIQQKRQIKVVYEGSPSSGMVFGENSVYTAYDTCHWMICDQDNPGDKASLRLTLDLPSELTVVASGVEVSKKNVSKNLVRHIWKQDRPYSAYVFGFAAGLYNASHAQAGKTELDFFSSVLDEAKLSKIFQDTSKMISFFEEKSGIPFPHARYAQIVVPGGEAQEVSSYSVLGSDHVEPLLKDSKEDWALVHELAHQWWGNYITCSSWDHFWLNEGLVVFMTAAYKEQRWGKSEYDKEMDIARKRYQVAKDAGMDVSLIKGQSLPTLKMRRAIIYSKGALFLDTLRRQMGETPFWSGLKEYSVKYAGRTVESKDFASIMVSHGNSDTSKLFQDWVFQETPR